MPVHEPTPQLRASDADREAAVERLRVAAIEGRLDADELDERLAAAYQARFCADLARLTADVTPPPVRRMAGRPTPAHELRARPVATVNRLAIASLVLALCWWLWFGSLAAVVTGHIALRQIAGSDGTQSGRRLAIAGLALGYLSLLPLILRIFWEAF